MIITAYILIFTAQLGVGALAYLASERANRAAARADAAQIEAAKATAEAHRARNDLRRVASLLLAEVERAEVVKMAARADAAARSKIVIPEVTFRERDLPSPPRIPVHAIGDAEDREIAPFPLWMIEQMVDDFYVRKEVIWA